MPAPVPSSPSSDDSERLVPPKRKRNDDSDQEMDDVEAAEGNEEKHKTREKGEGEGSRPVKMTKSSNKEKGKAKEKASGGPALEDLFANEDEMKRELEDDSLLEGLDDHANPMVMAQFYRRLFPWKQLFLWLNQDQAPTRLFTHREFAFTLQNEAYLRYHSFSNYVDLSREAFRLNPARFEIGAIYSARPRDKRALVGTGTAGDGGGGFRSLKRELVFDLDATDYDPVRTCCKDKSICKRCWGLIAAGVKVIDKLLREDFGYRRILWVYSGRRGIHCWVSDPEALALTDDQRKALVNYIDIIRGGPNQDKKVVVYRPLHPGLARSLEILKKRFWAITIKDQDCFKTEDQWELLLRLVLYTGTTKHYENKLTIDNLRKAWKKGGESMTSATRWTQLQKATAEAFKDGRFRVVMEQALEDVVLQWTYPRIDTKVSIHQNHLLKSPFCVHPGTGRVCVPIDPAKIDDFDPDRVPTVSRLLRELELATSEQTAGANPTANPNGSNGTAKGEDNGDVAMVKGDVAGVDQKDIKDLAAIKKAREKEREERERRDGLGWEKTSLRPFVEMLEKHAEGLIQEHRKEKKAREENRMEF